MILNKPECAPRCKCETPLNPQPMTPTCFKNARLHAVRTWVQVLHLVFSSPCGSFTQLIWHLLLVGSSYFISPFSLLLALYLFSLRTSSVSSCQSCSVLSVLSCILCLCPFSMVESCLLFMVWYFALSWYLILSYPQIWLLEWTVLVPACYYDSSSDNLLLVSECQSCFDPHLTLTFPRSSAQLGGVWHKTVQPLSILGSSLYIQNLTHVSYTNLVSKCLRCLQPHLSFNKQFYEQQNTFYFRTMNVCEVNLGQCIGKPVKQNK